MEELSKMKDTEMLFGGGLAFKLMVEREMLGRSQRLIREDSEYLGLKVSMGINSEISFGDFMGHDNPLKVYHNTHEMMVKEN